MSAIYDYNQAMDTLNHIEELMGLAVHDTPNGQAVERIQQVKNLVETFRRQKEEQEVKALEYIQQNAKYKLSHNTDILIWSSEDLSESQEFSYILSQYLEADPAVVKEKLDNARRDWFQAEKLNLNTGPMDVIVEIRQALGVNSYELKAGTLGEIIFSYIKEDDTDNLYRVYLDKAGNVCLSINGIKVGKKICFRRLKNINPNHIVDLNTFIISKGYEKITDSLGPVINGIYNKVRFINADEYTYHHIMRKCYEYYRIQWMLEKGFTVGDLIDKLQNTANTDDDGGIIKSETPLLDILERWECGNAGSGQSWVPYFEFRDTIFCDRRKMKTLLENNKPLLDKWNSLKPEPVKLMPKHE